MRKRRRATVVLLLLALAFLLAAGARGYAAWDTNRQIEEAFKPLEETYASAPQSPYLAGVPVHEMDLEALEFYHTFKGGNTNARLLVLPTDVCYYLSPDEKEPIEVIPKGTTVALHPQVGRWETQVPWGFGVMSYPTYQAGWRYVRMVQVDKELDAESAEQQPFYYTRRETMEQLVQAMYSQFGWTDETFEDASYIGYDGPVLDWMGSHSGCYLNQVDWQLYRGGAYISPDLHVPLWDGWNTLLAVAAAVLLAGSVMLRRKGKKGALPA